MADLLLPAGAQMITRCGYRAQRVGEAQHPGPEGLTLWSKNIGSWHKHAASLMSDAAEAGVAIMALQETNLGPHAEPAALNLARRMGWNMLHVRQTGRRRGGVALLVRTPLALRPVVQNAAVDCPWLFAEVLGLSKALRLALPIGSLAKKMILT